MNATATIAPAGPQHMRALERANQVRLARAELKRRVASGEIERRRGDPRVPVGGRQHGRRRPADEPAPLGPDALPQVPRPDPDVREEDGRLDDRAPASHAGGDAHAPRGSVTMAQPMADQQPPAPSAWRSYGQPDESLTCHQPASIPIRPRRGRTSHTPQRPRRDRPRARARTCSGQVRASSAPAARASALERRALGDLAADLADAQRKPVAHALELGQRQQARPAERLAACSRAERCAGRCAPRGPRARARALRPAS